MNEENNKLQPEEEKLIEFISKMELYDKGIYDIDINSWLEVNEGGDFIE